MGLKGYPVVGTKVCNNWSLMAFLELLRYHEGTVLNPIKSATFEFISDNVSMAISVDLSLPHYGLDLRGANPLAPLLPTVSSTFTGSLTATAALVGTILTLTFSAPPPQFDGSNNLVQYTASVVLKLGA